MTCGLAPPGWRGLQPPLLQQPTLLLAAAAGPLRLTPSASPDDLMEVILQQDHQGRSAWHRSYRRGLVDLKNSPDAH